MLTDRFRQTILRRRLYAGGRAEPSPYLACWRQRRRRRHHSISFFAWQWARRAHQISTVSPISSTLAPSSNSKSLNRFSPPSCCTATRSIFAGGECDSRTAGRKPPVGGSLRPARLAKNYWLKAGLSTLTRDEEIALKQISGPPSGRSCPTARGQRVGGIAGRSPGDQDGHNECAERRCARCWGGLLARTAVHRRTGSGR